MAQEESYKIVLSAAAQRRYQDEILAYLVQHFSVKRASEVDNALFQTVSSLRLNPKRGTKEKQLSHLSEDFRFILYKESRNFEIKIIYFTQEETETVFVTDFFPTKKHPKNML